MNCTVPVAAAGVIAAVSVTVVPWATGEAGVVVSVVLVAVAAMGTLSTGVAVRGVAWDTPPMSNAPPAVTPAVTPAATATATARDPDESRVRNLFLRTM